MINCAMCNSMITGEFDPYRISMPDGMQRDVCGRCYMLVQINDTLKEIKEVLKDGGLRIA